MVAGDKRVEKKGALMVVQTAEPEGLVRPEQHFAQGSVYPSTGQELLP